MTKKTKQMLIDILGIIGIILGIIAFILVIYTRLKGS